MSLRRMEMIWRHDKVLPYIFQELKSKIEAITPVQAIYLFGSRARTPLYEWEKLEGKDWDILVVCKFPIINTAIWTTGLNYNIDLKITDPKGAENFFKHQKQTIELFPTNQLNL